MTFKPLLPSHFYKQFKKLTKKDGALEQRLGKKIKAICENPEIGEPKSHNLKGLRGEHEAVRLAAKIKRDFEGLGR